MKVYRYTSNKQLFGFKDSIGSIPILGQCLADWQQRIVKEANCKLIDISSSSSISKDEPFLIFNEDLFFTKAFFKKALSSIQKDAGNQVFALAKNTFNTRFILPTDENSSMEILFPFYFVNTDHVDFCRRWDDGKASEGMTKKILTQTIYDFDTRIPDQLVFGGVYAVPQCDTFAAEIISPFHLLQVNMAVNLNRTIRIQKGKFLTYFKGLKGRLGSYFFYRGLKHLNKIGKNCFIHPTAIIEGSIIGDNVKIGANSVVRLSHVGNDCSISDNVVVANCVLGKKTYISNSNFIELCLTYDEVFLIHGPYQFSVFGEKSACFAVINCDFRLDQKSIRIPTSRGIIDSQQPFLGIAYGHRSKTGGGNIIAAGRIVPNDRHIIPPDSIILKFEE